MKSISNTVRVKKVERKNPMKAIRNYYIFGIVLFERSSLYIDIMSD